MRETIKDAPGGCRSFVDRMSIAAAAMLVVVAARHAVWPVVMGGAVACVIVWLARRPGVARRIPRWLHRLGSFFPDLPEGRANRAAVCACFLALAPELFGSRATQGAAMFVLSAAFVVVLASRTCQGSRDLVSALTRAIAAVILVVGFVATGMSRGAPPSVPDRPVVVPVYPNMTINV